MISTVNVLFVTGLFFQLYLGFNDEEINMRIKTCGESENSSENSTNEVTAKLVFYVLFHIINTLLLV